MTANIFANYYATYRERGWSPLPLPAGKKHAPPTGTTGRSGRSLDDAEIEAFLTEPHDLAVRIPHGVVAFDWDDYRGDAMAEQAALELLHGDLPETWSTSSRRFPSRIDYYRLPEGHEDHEFPGGRGCMDVIQAHHRYAKVLGAHPDTGADYRWIDPDGNHQ